MPDALRLFVVAGEPSGDRLGADLVRRLRGKVGVDLFGVGGALLDEEGLQSIFPMSDLSVMGLRDVLARLPRLLWRIRQTTRAILKLRPDVVLLIDSQVFARLVAKSLRRAGYRAPVLLYVAPSIWGRAPERARKLRPLFDEVLAVLPFEPKLMAELGGPPTHYIGHPAQAEAAPLVQAEGDLVALLPGSRAGELKRHLPLMRAVAEALSRDAGVSQFFLPTLPDLAEVVGRETAAWPVPVAVVADRAERRALYARSRFAVTSAGTATLELALAGVPMIVTFRMERAQAWQYEKLGHPLVSLPNIVLSRRLVPEILLDGPDPTPLVTAALELGRSPPARDAQRQAFAELAEMMATGQPGVPREDAADRVLAHFRRSRESAAVPQRSVSGT